MAPSGRSLASVALIAVSLVLFIPAFANLSIGAGDWVYGEQLSLVIDQFPVLLAVGAAAILLFAATRR